MLRVAVISDSHGDFRHIGKIRAALGRVDWLLHAGDHLQDAHRIAVNLGVERSRVRAVAGNCDMPLREPVHELLELEGVRILVTHGHHYSVKKTVQRLHHRAREAAARVVVFGHTHEALTLDEGGVLLFNPGSIALPDRRAGAVSCGVLELEDGHVSARHIFVSGGQILANSGTK